MDKDDSKQARVYEDKVDKIVHKETKDIKRHKQDQDDSKHKKDKDTVKEGRPKKAGESKKGKKESLMTKLGSSGDVPVEAGSYSYSYGSEKTPTPPTTPPTRTLVEQRCMEREDAQSRECEML